MPEELRLEELDEEAALEELRLAEELEEDAAVPLDLLVDWPDVDADDLRVEEEAEVVVLDEEELPAALLLVCPPMSAERANIAAISTAVTILFAMFFISDEF